MLDKFNKLFNKILFEQVESEEEQACLMNDINNSDAFFRCYISPLADKLNLIAVKAMYNVFRVTGPTELLLQFFKNFKVDKQFMPEKQIFVIGNVSVCLPDSARTNKFNKKHGHQLVDGIGTEGETLQTETDKFFNNSSRYGFNANITNHNVIGKWIDLIQYDKTEKTKNEQFKTDTPQNIAKRFKTFIKQYEISSQDPEITIEFMVNTDKLPNNSFDQMRKAVPMETLSNVGIIQDQQMESLLKESQKKKTSKQKSKNNK